MEERTNNDNVESKRGGSYGGIGGAEVVLRVMAMVLTLIAALMTALIKETKTVSIAVLRDFSIPFPLTAKFSHVSAFIYLVVANSIASAIAALSLVLTRRRRSHRGALVKAVGDLIAAALLLSAIGAGGGVGVIAYNGNSHLMWDRVCNNFGNFCGGMLASISLSLVASILFLLLVLLSLNNLPRT